MTKADRIALLSRLRRPIEPAIDQLADAAFMDAVEHGADPETVAQFLFGTGIQKPRGFMNWQARIMTGLTWLNDLMVWLACSLDCAPSSGLTA